MHMFPSRHAAVWARQPLSHLWTFPKHASAYLTPPRMTLVQARTQFGRLEHRHGPLALLLTVAFHNESAQRILFRSLAIKSAGTWYHPIAFLGEQVHLFSDQGQQAIPLARSHSLLAAPYIPAAAVAERFALFRLPEVWTRWPTHLQVIVKATFVRRRSRRLVVTLMHPA